MFSIHILTLAVTAIPAALAQNFYGCYTEGAGVRALTGNSTNDPAMTLSMCQTFCSSFSLYLFLPFSCLSLFFVSFFPLFVSLFFPFFPPFLLLCPPVFRKLCD